MKKKLEELKQQSKEIMEKAKEQQKKILEEIKQIELQTKIKIADKAIEFSNEKITSDELKNYIKENEF